MKREIRRPAMFRLELSLLKRLDAHARRMNMLVKGVRFTRTDALRSLLTEGLNKAESA